MGIKNLTDILVTNYPDHSPVLRFDGVGGIQMSNVNTMKTRMTYWIMIILQRLRE